MGVVRRWHDVVPGGIERWQTKMIAQVTSLARTRTCVWRVGNRLAPTTPSYLSASTQLSLSHAGPSYGVRRSASAWVTRAKRTPEGVCFIALKVLAAKFEARYWCAFGKSRSKRRSLAHFRMIFLRAQRACASYLVYYLL